MFKAHRLLAAAVVSFACSTAWAVAITPGFTFSVADSFTGAAGVGTHYHSNTGGAFGNPAGLAEVGRLLVEEVRGLSEYNLAGLGISPTAFVTFDVNQLGGLFGQSNFQGTIAIFSYVGNNAENLTDFEKASSGSVATFDTTGLAVGSVLSFDITSIFNTAITSGDGSLGIRLQLSPLVTPNEAIVFNNFRLTTDDQTSGAPEPGTLALLGLGLAGLAAVRRRK